MNYANRVLWGVPVLMAALCLAACSGLPQNNSGATGGTGGSGNFTIGGNVSGLTGTGLVLQNNGADNLSVTASGTFTFATAVKSGGSLCCHGADAAEQSIAELRGNLRIRHGYGERKFCHRGLYDRSGQRQDRRQRLGSHRLRTRASGQRRRQPYCHR